MPVSAKVKEKVISAINGTLRDNPVKMAVITRNPESGPRDTDSHFIDLVSSRPLSVAECNMIDKECLITLNPDADRHGSGKKYRIYGLVGHPYV
ncbi:MAG: hypothetical protein MPK62_01675 [Alphaproteobacteria bacterium]|nr:hypothetical protein [Alphaproteobacteria bacterium]MDA8029842.1 hypothetical protein [Alphaproteobacteria bacterium]